MQACNRIYYSKVYWRLNTFRAAHRSSSGAHYCIYSLLFIYTCGDRPLSRLSGNVELSINSGIINSITRLHLVGYFYWFIKVPFRNEAQFSADTVMDMTIDNKSRCWPLKTGFTQLLTKPFKIANSNNTFYLFWSPLTITVPACTTNFMVIYSWKYMWLKSDAFHTFVMRVTLRCFSVVVLGSVGS